MGKRAIIVAWAALAGGCVLPPGVPYALPVAGSSNIAIGGLIPGGSPVVLNPFAPPVVVPGGVLIGLPTLEGRWILLGQDGTRNCLTIQNARVSILIEDCAADSTGRAATIRQSPQAELAGPSLVLTVDYIGELFTTNTSTLTFTGTLQADGDFAGVLRVRRPNPHPNDPTAPDEIFVEVPAVMARP